MEENRMKQLTGADEMWFSLETPITPMHISDIHIYDPSTAPEGRVTREDVLAHIRQRLDRLCMREKRVPVPFGLDCSYWVEDEAFDLEYHVRHTKLPKPGTWRIGVSMYWGTKRINPSLRFSRTCRRSNPCIFHRRFFVLPSGSA